MRPIGAEILARVGELGDVSGRDYERQPLQGPEIGDHRHLRLADREDGVGGGDTDVAGGDQVDAAADAVPVNGGDDGLGAFRHCRDGGLQPQHLGVGAGGLLGCGAGRSRPGLRAGFGASIAGCLVCPGYPR